MRWWTAAVGFVLAIVGLLFMPEEVAARPGGGQGWSGGGGGGSGGGGGGGDIGMIYLLVRLCIEYPAVGVPAVVLFFIYMRVQKGAGGQTSWEVGAARVAIPMKPRSVDLEPLRKRDPEFSRVLFEDFIYALYAEAHRARHDPKALSLLSPYLEPAARQHLAERQPVGTPVQAAIVGALRITALSLPPPAAGGAASSDVQVSVDLEANLVLPDATLYLRETWRLARAADARTRPWKGIRTFGCPSCGAPPETSANVCASCGNPVQGGRFDWTVRRVSLRSAQSVPPALTGTVAEHGTNLPTINQPGVRERWDGLLKDDSGVTLESLSARIQLMFAELNTSWAAQDLKAVRPFVSESMHGYLRYWIDAYQAQGLVNKVEGARIERWVPVRVDRDHHYDAVTVRLWGTGRDVTREAASGRVVGGDPRRDRRYSEYWTLIRGAKVRGAPRIDKVCPGCGAPLAVNMSGNCDYCNSLITTGEFDWVLSRIEQDDVYAG